MPIISCSLKPSWTTYSYSEPSGRFQSLLQFLPSFQPRPCPEWSDIYNEDLCAVLNLLNKSLISVCVGIFALDLTLSGTVLDCSFHCGNVLRELKVKLSLFARPNSVVLLAGKASCRVINFLASNYFCEILSHAFSVAFAHCSLYFFRLLLVCFLGLHDYVCCTSSTLQLWCLI